MTCCTLPLDHGDWTASLIDLVTGAELPLERHGWIASAGRRRNQVSEATMVLDREYARRFDRRPELWTTKLALYRDGRLEWIGPIVGIEDTAEQLVWNARDLMAYVIDRRWFWRAGTYAGDTSTLMNIALDAADFGDSTGLQREWTPTGVIADMPTVAGDKIGPAIETLGVPWTVIADTIRFGDIDRDSEVLLPADAWGDDQPSITADGFERLSHVAAVTTNNGRVFYPSADPADRPAGSPLLVDTIDVGDVSIGAARALARQAWLERQGELSIIGNDDLALTDRFPLPWTALEPGVLMRSSAQGSQLTVTLTDVPVRITAVNVDIADSTETSVTVDVAEASDGLHDLNPNLRELDAAAGTVVPDFAPYPLGQPGAGINWAAVGGDAAGADLYDGSGFDFGSGPLIDGSGWTTDQLETVYGSGQYGDYSGIDWDGLGLVADADSSNWGGLPGPDPAFNPIDASDFDDISPIGALGVDTFNVDPFADCPPAYCCDQCGGFGGPATGVGPGKIWVATSLSLNDTTWISKDNEVRTIAPYAGAVVADGGISLSPFNNEVFLVSPSHPWADIASTTVTWEIELTTWWTPDDIDWRHQQFPQIAEANFNWFITPIGWVNEDLANPKPPTIALLDYNEDPDVKQIPIDPSSVGLSGWARGRIKISHNPATGATSVWLANSDEPGGKADLLFVLQGSETLDTTGGAASSSLVFKADGYFAGLNHPGPGFERLRPQREASPVIHDVTGRASELGGWFLILEETDLINKMIEHQPGKRVSAPFNFGNCIFDHGVGWPGKSRGLWSPWGSPLYTHENYSSSFWKAENTTRADIWDGGRLSDPVIAASNFEDPHNINLYEVDPVDWHDYVLENELYGMHVWAIADRDFLNVPLDANGWPQDWWPFGMQHK